MHRPPGIALHGSLLEGGLVRVCPGFPRRFVSEEGAVPFVTDLGKGAGRRRQRRRDKREIAHGRGPLHLRGVANEGARKAAVDRVVWLQSTRPSSW
jgi:hypothetical protein